MKYNLALSNPLCRFLDKPKEDFTKSDLLKVIEEKNVERITFRYTGLDGHLKELKIPVTDKKVVERILTDGERVDGSSLLKGIVETGKSDMYIVPVYSTAFYNPFYPELPEKYFSEFIDEDKKNKPLSLDFICRYLGADGVLSPYPPDNILRNAYDELKKNTGFDLYAFGELEFYIFNQRDSEMYTPFKQTGYHASPPFIKTSYVLSRILKELSLITGNVKYGHSEVGYINKLDSSDTDLHGRTGEQMEVEFLPAPAYEAADNIVIAKWVIRNVSYRYGMLSAFNPKFEEGDAGNGMHIHMALYKDNKNVLTSENGELSMEARKLAGGLCNFADSLTAFGNMSASSYIRLVPDQEAPTKICWSDSNRSALIRVPLGWRNVENLASKINKGKSENLAEPESRQTIELRSPDGGAKTHLLIAGILIAAEWGLTNEESLKIADDLYVKGNIFENKELLARLPSLPSSCHASAQILRNKKHYFTKKGIFPESVIEYVIELLENEHDENLMKKLSRMGNVSKSNELREIMHQKIHRN